ncbi:MAG: chlorohydrolase [Elusimicrobia bacterium CG03_land_8_20_14_0_80_50_18]|nr:MAG: chlorohydrolase [Elusimicrobia bacterium CG03_land_8_20_14_0_80_50_18]PIX13957.1 MAG: chlorohydrolase [Elusimicrobia bacterium CG_4_8_14_3_um_filter_50_9]
MSKILIKNGTVFDGKNVRKADVYIKDGKIDAVASKIRRSGVNVIDAEGKVVLPGFICAHHHLYSTMARGMGIPGVPAKNFQEVLDKLWWPLDRALDKDDIYLSALYALGECIRWGTTTIIDHHESQSYQKGSLDTLMKACEKAGIRTALTLGSSDRYGKGLEGVEENERFLKKLKKEKHPLIRCMVGLHAAFTVNDKTLKASADLAKKYNCGLHVHVAEAKSDEDASVKKYKMRVLERLNKLGALGKKTILVHCVHVSGKEAALIKKSGSIVVHNPESNMNNAVGWADVLGLLKKGILVGLGSDGMSSNMLQQLRCAYLIARHANADPRVGFMEAPTMLLQNNAEIASRIFGGSFGTIAKGKVADIAIMDYLPPTPLNSGNFLGHLIFGLVNSQVDTTIASGRILMQNKKILAFDEKKLSEAISKRAPKFWKKFNKEAASKKSWKV